MHDEQLNINCIIYLDTTHVLKIKWAQVNFNAFL